MKKIAYLLHRFPEITDTFIRREIRALQKLGTDVQVISVWTPHENETTPALRKEWSAETTFLLPRSAIFIAGALLKPFLLTPRRFLQTVGLAIVTARPGFRGFTYQLFYFVEAVLTARALNKNKIDHVHNHIGDHSGTVTMLAANLAGIGYSISFHGWPVFFDAKYSRIKEKVKRARFTRSVSYFCRSQLMMFSESEDPAPFRVVHCGLNIDKYPYRRPRDEVRRLFSAARLSPEKGFGVLVQALRLLRDKGHDVELRLAGGGPSKEHLETLAADLGVADRITFLGYLSEDEVIRELQSADLFVLPSFVEGVPVSAMEAMAVGVPVIATNVGGTAELVEQGKTGLLVPASDPHALMCAVVTLKSDQELRLRLAEFGRQKVTAEFDVQKESTGLNNYLLES